MMELDIFLPHEQLAFEYQGEGHFHEVYALGSLGRQMERDQVKRIACKERGITLVEIPYWWDFEKSSLMATIHECRNDLLPKQEGQPIPKTPPTDFRKNTKKKYR